MQVASTSLIYQYKFKEKYKIGMDRNNNKIKNVIMPNGKYSAIWRQAAHTHLPAIISKPLNKSHMKKPNS